MYTRLLALRYLSTYLQQQPYGPEYSVTGTELYGWLRAYLSHAGQRQRSAYGYAANHLYCTLIDAYRCAGGYVGIEQGQEFFDVEALHNAVERLYNQLMSAGTS